MKKTRLLLGCLAVVAILGLAVGCMYPEYGLEFSFNREVDDYDGDLSDDDTRIFLTVTNSGSYMVSNVYVNTDVIMNNAGIDENLFYIGSLDSGESETVSVTYYNDSVNQDPRVIEVLWDSEDD